jgi:hypothetical protein
VARGSWRRQGNIGDVDGHAVLALQVREFLRRHPSALEERLRTRQGFAFKPRLGGVCAGKLGDGDGLGRGLLLAPLLQADAELGHRDGTTSAPESPSVI